MSLEVIGRTQDLRTNTHVVYAQIEINDYLDLVGQDFDKFNLQRKREKHKAYKRLKDDIIAGALLPPITLALKPDIAKEVKEKFSELDNDKLADLLKIPNQVHILDGLQRTYTINDISQKHLSLSSNGVLKESPSLYFKKGQKLLLEFWIEDDIHNLIYRFIVLNAGRKEMALNHQLELLFMTIHKKLEQDIEGLEIYVSKDDTYRDKPKKYLFNHLVTSYHCFITKSYKINKENLVARRLLEENVVYSTEEELSNDFDLFKRYMLAYTHLDAATYSLYEDTPFQNWFAKENVMNAFFAALANYGNRNEERKLRIHKAMTKLFSLLGIITSSPSSNNKDADISITFPKSSNNESVLFSITYHTDLLGLYQLEEVINGISPARYNVSIATKKLLFNSFKEFFRESGEKPLKEIWAEEAVTV